jgi:hypothetical protein
MITDNFCKLLQLMFINVHYLVYLMFEVTRDTSYQILVMPVDAHIYKFVPPHTWILLYPRL